MTYMISYNWRNHPVLSRIWPVDYPTALRHFERLAANPDATNVQLHEDRIVTTANVEP